MPNASETSSAYSVAPKKTSGALPHVMQHPRQERYLATAILAGTIIWWIDWVQTQFRFRLGPNWSTAGGAGRASGGAARPIQGCRRSTMPHDLAWHSAALLKQRQRTATLLQRWQRLSARFECR